VSTAERLCLLAQRLLRQPWERNRFVFKPRRGCVILGVLERLMPLGMRHNLSEVDGGVISNQRLPEQPLG